MLNFYSKWKFLFSGKVLLLFQILVHFKVDSLNTFVFGRSTFTFTNLGTSLSGWFNNRSLWKELVLLKNFLYLKVNIFNTFVFGSSTFTNLGNLKLKGREELLRTSQLFSCPYQGGGKIDWASFFVRLRLLSRNEMIAKEQACFHNSYSYKNVLRYWWNNISFWIYHRGSNQT